jgi:hypothetical protein
MVPGGNFFSVFIPVLLLYLFFAFQFYEVHFETRKYEPLRIDNPVKDSLCLSRITFIFSSPVLMLVFLSLLRHVSNFFGLKRNFRVVTLCAGFILLYELPL